MGHHRILLYGFHFSFIFIFSLAVIRDLYFGNIVNAMINAAGVMLTLLSYYLLHFKGRRVISSYMIIAIAIIPLYALIYLNHFGNLVIIYVILIPLAVFFLLPFREAFAVNIFVFLLLISMLYYISIIQPDAPILNNPKALINITFVSVLTMLFGVFYHMAIEAHMKKLIHSNRQKDILLKEVHHRVKNNLNVTASMLGLQAMLEPVVIREQILKSKSRIEAIAQVHEMIYSQDSFDQILFYDYMHRLQALFAKVYPKENYLLDIKVDRELTFSLDSMVHFGLMLNEMLTNSLKYAVNSSGLSVGICMAREKYGYRFVYRDNGVDHIDTAELELKKGVGIQLIELSVRQLDGEMSIYYEQGLVFSIRVPYV